MAGFTPPRGWKGDGGGRQILPPGRKGDRFWPATASPANSQAIEITYFSQRNGAGPVLADGRSVHRERRPVVSVTSEIASNLSFQSSQRVAKSDAPPANDSFASLVDSNNAAADNNNRAGDSAAPASNNSSAPRRPDDTAAKAGGARDNSAA